MLSILLGILGVLAGIAACAALFWALWEYVAPWVNWAVETVYTLFDTIPPLLLPFALIAIVLAVIGWAVKLL